MRSIRARSGYPQSRSSIASRMGRVRSGSSPPGSRPAGVLEHATYRRSTRSAMRPGVWVLLARGERRRWAPTGPLESRRSSADCASPSGSRLTKLPAGDKPGGVVTLALLLDRLDGQHRRVAATVPVPRAHRSARLEPPQPNQPRPDRRSRLPPRRAPHPRRASLAVLEVSC